VTRTVQRDWPESCFGARNCDELASNFLCKFPAQVSGTSFMSLCRRLNFNMVMYIDDVCTNIDDDLCMNIDEMLSILGGIMVTRG